MRRFLRIRWWKLKRSVRKVGLSLKGLLLRARLSFWMRMLTIRNSFRTMTSSFGGTLTKIGSFIRQAIRTSLWSMLSVAGLTASALVIYLAQKQNSAWSDVSRVLWGPTLWVVLSTLVALIIIYLVRKQSRHNRGTANATRSRVATWFEDAGHYFGERTVFCSAILAAIVAFSVYACKITAIEASPRTKEHSVVRVVDRLAAPVVPRKVDEPIKAMMHWSHGAWQSGARTDEEPALAYIYQTNTADFVFDTLDGKSVVRWHINMNSATCGSKHQDIPSIDGYFWLKPDTNAPSGTRWIGSDITVRGHGSRNPADERDWSKIVLEVAKQP